MSEIKILSKSFARIRDTREQARMSLHAPLRIAKALGVRRRDLVDAL
jgi:hypothetical protein